MKKILMMLMLMVSVTAFAQQNKAEIKFDKMVHNFGKFSEKEPVQTAVFTFTNTGTGLLIINSAMASCGCTVPTFTKTPIKPGETGTVKVTYNGKGKFPGHFRKTVTLRTNATIEMHRLYVEGDMEEAK